MDEGVTDRVPDWLQARYIAVAAELERMHGATFAAAYLDDVGVTALGHVTATDTPQ
jgi:hypothetical protein